MAKVVKSTREVLDIDEELKKVKNTTSNSKIEEKKENKNKKKNDKKSKKQKSSKEKKGIFKFFHDVNSEVAKVKWPTKKDMIKYSVATISFVLFFGIYFSIINLIVAAIKMWV